MTEKKDIQTLLNEAEELLNKCKKNGIQDIFPKEIKVLGKSIIASLHDPTATSFFVFDNTKGSTNRNPLGLDFGDCVGNIFLLAYYSNISRVDIKIQIGVDMICDNKRLSLDKTFNGIKKEDLLKTIQNKAIPTLESFIKKAQEFSKKQQYK